jgi:tRNA A37 threonylcarbamoyladenosine synthetase subunit TsaC/SUA5/YrdC
MSRVILAQTDTTVGFLSTDETLLDTIKQRPSDKQYLTVFPDLKSFSSHGHRIPKRHHAFIRRARKTTFVTGNRAFRIVSDGPHHRLLQALGWFYSTSANLSGHAFERSFCEANVDIIVEDNRGLYEAPPSAIYRLSRRRRKQLR